MEEHRITAIVLFDEEDDVDKVLFIEDAEVAKEWIVWCLDNNKKFVASDFVEIVKEMPTVQLPMF